MGQILVSLWEDCGNVVPSLRFNLVPQPAVHKRILLIFGHFFPQELFTFAYSCHVFDRQFVLRTGRLGAISACPTSVLLVPLGQTQNGCGTGAGSRTFHHLHFIMTLFTLFLITGFPVTPILLGLGLGHGDTWFF